MSKRTTGTATTSVSVPLMGGSGRGINGLNPASGVKRSGARPCADCTCSPGLLSRQGRRSSLFLRHLSNTRKKTSSTRELSSGISEPCNESVYSSDSLCVTRREVNTTERLKALRKQMIKNDLCCYIVPSEDAHQSEYVSALDQRRAFISGFSGSAGVACITRDLLNFNEKDPDGKSIISTDGRYFNQAKQELDFNWTLLRQGEDPVTWEEWCIREAEEMSDTLKGKVAKIGVDPKLISFTEFQKLSNMIKQRCTDKVNLELVAVEENLIDKIWGKFEEIPERPANDLILLEHEFHGEEFQSKRERLLKSLREINKTTPDNEFNSTFLVSALDEICWLLNLRGSDIAYNPVFYAYVLINVNETILFCNNPCSDEIKNYFELNGITLKMYDEVWSHLTQVTESAQKKKDSKISFLLPDTSSWQIVRSLKGLPFKLIHSPIDIHKSVKNAIEIGNAHNAQVKDALCLIQYFAWLEHQLVVKEALIDEHKAACKLKEIRMTQKNFMGNSFETISSTGANAAIIHYAPPETGSSMIDPCKVYLCDSGSQFKEGTTDITRTVHMLKPSAEEIKNYTLVLKGNLALERLVFPEGTSGYKIDVLARQYLWAQGLDYKHGTGHGIGSFLNVHEGPIGIGIRPHYVEYSLKAGNIISNEPGYYKDGEYGLRIENDMLVKEAPDLQFAGKKFLKFENITMVPYCRKLIDVKMLNDQERAQINEYHSMIYNRLVQYCQPQSITFKWLKRETTPL